jgi:hypothetical protein
MCGEISTAKECTLYWNKGHSTLHIPYGKKDNVATMYLSPGFHNFAVFCAEADLLDSDNDPVAHPTEVMSNEESECILKERRMSNSSIPFISIWQPTLKDEPDTCHKSISMVSADFNLNGPTTPTSEG